MIVRILRRFVLALQFLSVIQVWGRVQAEDADLPASMTYYPLVGLILGAATAWVHQGALKVWPPFVCDLTALLFMVVLTRALHLDGLADTLDGILGSHRAERSLEIMKDSSLGTFGVTGVVCIMLWKFAALTAVPMNIKFDTLLLMPVLGRHTMIQMAWLSPYARSSGGLGKIFVDGLTWKHYVPAGLFTLLVCFWAADVAGVMLFAAIWGLGILEMLLFKSRLGGVTGDVLGGSAEFNEAVILMILAAVGFGHP